MSMRNSATQGFIDQAAWSAGNLFVILALARATSVYEFGALSIAITIVMALTTAIRGFFGLPLILSAGAEVGVAAEGRFAVGAAALTGVAGSGILALVFVSIGRLDWLVLAASVPFLLVHEVSRCFAASNGTMWLASILDSLRAAALLGLFVYVAFIGIGSTKLVLTVWTVTSVIVSIQLAVMLRIGFKFKGIAAWFRDSWSTRATNGFDMSAIAITGAAYVLLLGFGIGASEVAGIRGAGSLMGPLNVLIAGLPIVLLPGLVKNVPGASRRLLKFSILLTSVSLGAGSVGLWLPDSLGRFLMGEIWPATALILPIMGIEYALQAIRNVYVNKLRARGANKEIVLNRIIVTLGMVAVGLLSAVLGSAVSVAWAMVIVSLIATANILRETYRHRTD